MKKQKYPVANPHVNQPKAFIILILIALLFIAGGIVFAIFAQKGVQGYVKTTATIVDIDYPLFYDDTTTAYVDYTFNGVTYSHQMLDSYTTGWGIGTIVDIYVNPQNPSEFHSTLTSNVAPYLIIGAGGFLFLIVILSGVSDLINCRVFAPKKTGENKIEVRIAGVTFSKNIAQTIYRIQFTKDGKTYQSGRLRGDGHLVETLAKEHPIDCVAYLDRAGHFVPDYITLNATLMSFKDKEGLGLVQDYHGLSPNDDGSGRYSGPF